MNRQQHSWTIPLASFALSLVVALVVPAERALSLRAPGNPTAPCTCTFKITSAPKKFVRKRNIQPYMIPIGIEKTSTGDCGSCAVTFAAALNGATSAGNVPPPCITSGKSAFAVGLANNVQPGNLSLDVTVTFTLSGVVTCQKMDTVNITIE